MSNKKKVIPLKGYIPAGTKVEDTQTKFAQENYQYNFYEWLSMNGEFIGACSASDIGVLTTIYTVPVNKILFITGLTLGYKTFFAGEGSLSLYVNGLESIRFSGVPIVGAADSVSLSPTFPIKLIAGQKVQIDGSGTSQKITGSMIGYLIDKEFDKTFA
jgi:hypothetical protein